MARRPDPDEEDEDFDDGELPDGVYYDDEPAMVSCPHCREQVYEEAQYCPRCENYIGVERRGDDAKPYWIWACLILALLASLFAAFL